MIWEILSVLGSLALMPAMVRRFGPLAIVMTAAGYLCCAWFAPLALILAVFLRA